MKVVSVATRLRIPDEVKLAEVFCRGFLTVLEAYPPACQAVIEALGGTVALSPIFLILC